MNIDEAIEREKALAYSFGERYKRLGEPVGNLMELEQEHQQMADWLNELKKSRVMIKMLAQELVYYESDTPCELLCGRDNKCENECNNLEIDCWIRWAMAKIDDMEVRANDD